MIVRSISPDEINEFCSVGLDEENAFKFKDRMLKAWEEKRSYPEWCFVAEDEGKFIARVAFDIFPSEPLNLMVWRLYVPEGCDYFKIGEKLFKGVKEQLEGKGFNLIVHHLYGEDDNKFNENREFFIRAGFEIQQEKKNYLFTEGELSKLSGRLTFKNLKEVGEEEYINGIKRVTEKTLDTYDELDVQKLGAEKVARSYFNLLKDIDYNEEWWKLAYEDNGDFAGLIVPQKFNEKVGAINYIGVEPGKRGNGYVKDLLIMGTSILKDHGIEEIIGDIDVNNFPMENALIEIGYRLNQKELVIEIRF